MARRYDDDDEDDDDFDDVDIRRRRRKRSRGEDASSRVAAPAIAMMIVGILSFVFLVLYCPFNLFVLLNNPAHQQKPKEERVAELVGAGLGVPLMAISSLIVAVGGYLMKSLTSYGGAMTGAVVSLIPCCSPCCVIGIPFGIWALIVLNDPVVKDGFRSGF